MDEIRRHRKAEELFERSGVPSRHKSVKLDDLSSLPTAVHAPYAAFVAECRRGLRLKGIILALIGRRGPGKTTIGCGLVREMCLAGKSAVYLDVVDYFIELKRVYRGTGGDEAAIEDKYLRPALLVLDSMEERSDSDWENRTLTRIINKRYAEDRNTILISNETQKDFAKRLGPSITDRICDGGGFLACSWSSLRGQLAPRLQEGATL